jgi:hypothetical protein
VRLKSGGGLNGSNLLTPGGTVLADGSIDRLTSGMGLDWLLRSIADDDLMRDLNMSDRMESF